MKNENYKSLLEVIKQRKPLIMDLEDNVFLHMKWEEETTTPDGVKGCYVDEMGMTSMSLILEILNGEVEIQGKKVKIREDI